MSVVGGVIDPPGLEEAYVLDNHGAFPQGGADGTVFVAMHAVNKGSAPGNAVTDVATGRATVVVGDSVIADGVTYLVDAVDLVLKADATNDDALWDPSIKGRLVVITCLPNPGGGAATRNVVITAHLATN
jgi:hypothetical protein